MCWVFLQGSKSIFLIMGILFLNCGLEYFSLGNLVPTWLSEGAGAKEGTKERVWKMALGTTPPAIEGFWTAFGGMSSE